MEFCARIDRDPEFPTSYTTRERRGTEGRVEMIGGHPALKSFDLQAPVEPDNSGYSGNKEGDGYYADSSTERDYRGLPVPRDPTEIKDKQELRFKRGDW